MNHHSMKTNHGSFFTGVVSLVMAGVTVASDPARDAHVAITFLRPETFTDLGSGRPGAPRERENILQELRVSMQKSAAGALRENLRLEITVKDIDLAGGFEEWRRPGLNEVRFVRDLYPPRMTLSYRLLAPDGRVLRKGETRLTNPDYLFGAQAGSDPLRHDKALFRDWLRTDFSEFRK
jgi:hypothetical protein